MKLKATKVKYVMYRLIQTMDILFWLPLFSLLVYHETIYEEKQIKIILSDTGFYRNQLITTWNHLLFSECKKFIIM